MSDTATTVVDDDEVITVPMESKKYGGGKSLGTRSWLLLFSLVGYCTLLAIPCIAILLVFSRMPLTNWNKEEGGPKVDILSYWMYGPLTWLCFSAAFMAAFNVSMFDLDPAYGPRPAWLITFPTYFIITLLFGCGLPSIAAYAGFDGIRYYLLDLLVVPVAMTAGYFIETSIRPKLMKRSQRKVADINSESNEFTEKETNSKEGRSTVKLLNVVLFTLTNILYPIAITP